MRSWSPGVASSISDECPLIPTVCLGDGQLGVPLGRARAFSRSERPSARSERGSGRNERGSGRSERGSGRGEGASSLIEAPVTVGALTLRHKFRGHRSTRQCLISGARLFRAAFRRPQTRTQPFFFEHKSRGPVYPSRSECRRRPNNGARHRRCGHNRRERYERSIT